MHDNIIAYHFSARLWRYIGPNAWYFITLPKAESEHIRLISHEKKAAWGSVRTEATIGNTIWRTSLFPDSKLGAYLLPVKADVRKREMLNTDQLISVNLSIKL